MKDLTRAPILLTPNNFTDLQRTPWAGSVLARHFKKNFLGSGQHERIGESWEISSDPTFPSYVLGSDLTLAELVQAFPDEILSPAWRELQQQPHCDLLVKLLNAAEPLSLQVHPQDDDPDLTADECGKPESWLILHAEPDAGVYLGFAQALSRGEWLEMLKSERDLSPYLHFVPVKENDFFEIPPGVPHAIGAGVTLLEPQRIRLGKTGKTYRMWDWNRRYNERGELDLQRGKPRPLHIDAALRLVNPEQQVGETFVKQLQKTPKRFSPQVGMQILEFPPLETYQVRRIHLDKGTNTRLHLTDGYAALIVLAGELTVAGSIIQTGQPALLPFAGSPFHFAASSEADYVIIESKR